MTKEFTYICSHCPGRQVVHSKELCKMCQNKGCRDCERCFRCENSINCIDCKFVKNCKGWEGIEDYDAMPFILELIKLFESRVGDPEEFISFENLERLISGVFGMYDFPPLTLKGGRICVKWNHNTIYTLKAHCLLALNYDLDLLYDLSIKERSLAKLLPKEILPKLDSLSKSKKQEKRKVTYSNNDNAKVWYHIPVKR